MATVSGVKRMPPLSAHNPRGRASNGAVLRTRMRSRHRSDNRPHG